MVRTDGWWLIDKPSSRLVGSSHSRRNALHVSSTARREFVFLVDVSSSMNTGLGGSDTRISLTKVMWNVMRKTPISSPLLVSVLGRGRSNQPRLRLPPPLFPPCLHENHW